MLRGTRCAKIVEKIGTIPRRMLGVISGHHAVIYQDNKILYVETSLTQGDLIHGTAAERYYSLHFIRILTPPSFRVSADRC